MKTLCHFCWGTGLMFGTATTYLIQCWWCEGRGWFLSNHITEFGIVTIIYKPTALREPNRKSEP